MNHPVKLTRRGVSIDGTRHGLLITAPGGTHLEGFWTATGWSISK